MFLFLLFRDKCSTMEQLKEQRMLIKFAHQFALRAELTYFAVLIRLKFSFQEREN